MSIDTHKHHSAEELADLARRELDAINSRTEPLKPKDRIAIPVQEMPVQDPDARRKNMSEVALGYSRAGARGHDPRNMGGVVVNPVKSEKVSFDPADRLIILARQ